jgi:hypothetical protein
MNEEDRLKNGTAVIRRVLERHTPVVMTMALGLRDLYDKGKIKDNDMPFIIDFLDKFYMNRIAIRYSVLFYPWTPSSLVTTNMNRIAIRYVCSVLDNIWRSRSAVGMHASCWLEVSIRVIQHQVSRVVPFSDHSHHKSCPTLKVSF